MLWKFFHQSHLPHSQAPAPPATADPWGAMREAGPVTSAAGTIGMKKAEVKAGLREVVLCKDGDGMIGLRVEDINNGIFICFVQAKSPAALSGLRSVFWAQL